MSERGPVGENRRFFPTRKIVEPVSLSSTPPADVLAFAAFAGRWGFVLLAIRARR
jgi:hypothetical protein